MKNKKFELLWAKYQETDAAEKRLAMMREFMMGSSFEELIAWNDYLAEMSQKSLKKIVAEGLTDEDRTFFKEQFAKFDDLEAVIKARKAA
jgi:S-adenosylmethionine:diacylglycerol 3-amino-3-carboxypropyl transferase